VTAAAETAYPKWNAVTQVLAPGGDGVDREDPTGAHPRLHEWRVMHGNPAECAAGSATHSVPVRCNQRRSTCASVWELEHVSLL